MAYQLYRNTTLGHTLQESLDELIQVVMNTLESHMHKPSIWNKAPHFNHFIEIGCHLTTCHCQLHLFNFILPSVFFFFCIVSNFNILKTDTLSACWVIFVMEEFVAQSKSTRSRKPKAKLSTIERGHQMDRWPALRFLRSQISVQTQQKSFGWD